MRRALLGLEPPPEEPFEGAALSPMAREFYADNKRVSIAKAKADWDLRPPIRPIARGSRRLRRRERGGLKGAISRTACQEARLSVSKRSQTLIKILRLLASYAMGNRFSPGHDRLT